MSIQQRSFTPSETAALTGLKETHIRKEIEYSVIETAKSSLLPFSALVYLSLLRRSPLSLRVQERSAVYRRLSQILSSGNIPEEIEVIEPFYLKLRHHVSQLQERVEAFLRWKELLGRNPEIMGGAETFPGSRLTVRRIGDALNHGVKIEELQEDYPYLKPQDFEFAALFVRAYPTLAHSVQEVA